MRRLALWIITALSFPVGLAGQSLTSADVGMKVRLRTKPRAPWVVGVVVAVDEDSLHLELASDSSRVAVARNGITELQASAGAHGNAGRGALIGFFVGATAGGFMGYSQGDDPPGLFSFSAGDKALVLGVLGGGAGALVGLVIGGSSRTDTWVNVPATGARVSLAPHGLGLAVSIAF
jgi:hypothetical protein